jgi:hypothetical protein
MTDASARGATAEASLFDKAAYLFALLGIYVMVGGLFSYSFWGKAIDGDWKISPALKKQFDTTFIGTIPGAQAAWNIVIVPEGVVFLLVLLSLVTLEFLPAKRKPFLLTALALALLDFGVLAFGQTATGQNEAVASLYSYFAATVIILVFVRTLPPYTSSRWLT